MVARKKLSDFSNAQVHTETFEDWPLSTHQFDLVMSATAFHWIDPVIRWQKSAAALRADGHLALFRYHHVAGGDRAFFEQFNRCYQENVAGANAGFRLPEISEFQSEHQAALEASGLFHSPEIRTYITEVTYTREQYISLLSTYSDHLSLDASVRMRLFECLGALIDREFNGGIRKCYLHELMVARKR